MYGIDVARFRDADGDGMGDLAGVIEKLDHVTALGATWIWLLPFYPSARRDNGYDVDDHLGVDPLLGTMADVEQLVEAAHERGLRVLLDLVVHHTSDRHPWFVASQQGERRYADYYVWRDEPIPPALDPSMFPGEESGSWSYSQRRGLWYRHAFYSFEPDLNHHHDRVREELFRIAESWADVGIDGFRIDAATHVTNGSDEPWLTFYDELRHRLEARRPGLLVIGEADLPPEEANPLLQDGRFDALLGFSLNNRVMLALARGDARPIADVLDALRGPGQDRWLTFLRNHDELDLEQLEDRERADVMARFAPSEHEQLYGRGIRRALAPMLGTRERLELSISLLFALPGLPLLMAGQEIGMGDDLSLSGRAAVRLTMQWDESPSGGFSAAGASPLVRAAQEDGPYGIPATNVARAESEAGSVLHLVRALAAMPRSREVEIEVLPAGAAAAPALLMRSSDAVTVHHLGDEPVEVPADGLGPHLLGPFTGGAVHASGYGWFGAR